MAKPPNSKKRLKNRIYRFVGSHRGSRPIRMLAKICDTFTNAYWSNDFPDMDGNGEALVLRKLSSLYGGQPATIFDVGSNAGQYATQVIKYLPEAQLHCFELIPPIYEQLANNANLALDNVRLNCAGLSDAKGKVDVTYYPSNTFVGGVNPPPWETRIPHLEARTITADVIKGDDYAAEHGISHIDLLKIDTEGHELFVLKGFEKLLDAGGIDVIQFEHGHTSIPSRTLLGDFYRYLTPRGYLIGRLHPRGVELKQYDLFDDEKFRMANYLAIHQSKTDIVERLNIASRPGSI